jgi:hypothetical protein
MEQLPRQAHLGGQGMTTQQLYATIILTLLALTIGAVEMVFGLWTSLAVCVLIAGGGLLMIRKL